MKATIENLNNAISELISNNLSGVVVEYDRTDKENVTRTYAYCACHASLDKSVISLASRITNHKTGDSTLSGGGALNIDAITELFYGIIDIRENVRLSTY